MKKEEIRELIKKYGMPYSEFLGIDLKSKRESEIFKWFLASILFGKPIQENVAIKTFGEFEKRNVLSPSKIIRAGWDRLVEILDAGSYVRYDFSTATKLLEIMKKLNEEYGTLSNLHRKAKNPKDLEKRLQEFKGVGPITANIFLRELRDVWQKANPEPLDLIKKTAKKLGIKLSGLSRKNRYFIKLECALFRISKHGKAGFNQRHSG